MTKPALTEQHTATYVLSQCTDREGRPRKVKAITGASSLHGELPVGNQFGGTPRFGRDQPKAGGAPVSAGLQAATMRALSQTWHDTPSSGAFYFVSFP